MADDGVADEDAVLTSDGSEEIRARVADMGGELEMSVSADSGTRIVFDLAMQVEEEYLISLLIIDENAFLRLGLRTAIEMGDDIKVVGDAIPGYATLNLVEDIRPDVVLMSLRWPDMESVSVCREISEKFPLTRVVMLSDREREEEIVLSLLAGAAGYVSKVHQGSELAFAIKVVAGGGTYFSAEIKEQVAVRLRSVFGDEPPTVVPEILSRREVGMLRMVGEGYRNEEIAQRLKLAPATVRNGVARIRSKLGLDSRNKLISYAARRGFLMSDEESSAGDSD